MGLKKQFYSEKIKLEIIQMKLSGDYINTETMEIHEIKNIM